MAEPLKGLAVGVALAVACGACGTSSPGATTPASSPPLHDAAAEPEAEAGGAAVAPRRPDASVPPEAEDASPPAIADSGSETGDEETTTLAADRFITGVVSFDPGECAGFGASSMPAIVEGPPVGGGSGRGSTDVVSLGGGGSIVVSFAPNAIVDGPGPDFIVFENPFWVSGNSNDVYAEPGEVSVSDDGVTWQVFPCTPTPDPQSSLGTGVEPPYGQCAGWHVVFSSPTNGISPVDPSVAGGDAFDLADLGVTHARYVRIVDKTLELCPEAGPRPDDNGFDLDAISIVNAEHP
jgi:hypothetical protein